MKSTYIIAEVGSNYDGKLEQAKKLIDIAAEAKADAVKFQLFRADVLYPKKTQPVYSVMKANEFPREWLGELKEYAERQKLDFLATPFDAEAIELLEKVKVKAYKWASSETTNHRLLVQVARTSKPVYMATGMCTMADIAEAVDILDSNGCKDLTLLHCYSVYPMLYEDANLRVIKTLREAFQKPVGFSDHSLGIALPIAAVALGATIIEKHFTLDRKLKGPDHSYAIEPHELKEMIAQIRNVEKAMGSPVKRMHPDELAWNRCDGVYARKPIKKGQILSADDLFVQRPAMAIASRYLRSLSGLRAKSDIPEGKPVNWPNIE